MVINVSRIGDTLLATPAIRAIAHAYPNAQITCIAHPKRAEVLEHLPFVYRVRRITKRSAPFRGWWPGRRHDLAFVFGFDEALVAYALRAAQRVIAFRQRDPRLNERLYRAVEPPAFQSEHAVLQLLRLPVAVDIAPAGLRLAYQVTAEESHWAEATLARGIPHHASPLIGLQIASFPTKAYRDWPIEHFKTLCDQIRHRWPHAHFLIFGGTLEQERTRAVAAHLGDAATHFAGHLSLRQTAALMSRLDLYVGVDTGPTHIMSAFDIPLVGLYHGSSRSELIGPLEHPCFYPVDHPRAGPDCPIDAPMAEISVADAMAQVEQALSEHPPRSR